MTGATARPTSIRIFLADGTPEGIRIVEKSNWTGRAVVASRAQLAEALHRDEIARPGVYVLVGPSETGTSRIYIGEADMLQDRLKQHAKQKDFWTPGLWPSQAPTRTSTRPMCAIWNLGWSR